MSNAKDCKSFFECLSDFMSYPEDLTQEELLDELKAQGIDVIKLDLRIAEIVKKGLAERRLSWLNKAREKRLEIIKLLDTAQIKKETRDLKAIFQDIVKGNFGQDALRYAETYFRKKESLSENDLTSLIEDLDHLGLLEELNKKED